MCSNLSCYQLETGNYFYRILYVNFTVTTRKKFIVNTKKKMKTESKHTTKEYHQNTRKERKRRNKQRGTTKTPRKQQNVQNLPKIENQKAERLKMNEFRSQKQENE